MFDFSVTVSCLLNIKKERIWNKISTPGIVHHYHPFCKENPVIVWNGDDSVDEIIYDNDLIYRREFTAWYDGIGYDLLIKYKENVFAEVFWHISEIDNHVNELRITLKPRLKNILPKTPRFVRWIPYYFFIRWQMKKYLAHVLRGFEIYITTGIKVKLNQFGSHRFYSKN
ncbi:MAG: hypothetical protein HeimC2_23480 [Candidatus Heimdallarchaeota archaeon LC_2]|nr:MAG: hypothetical protein HeimC2_23480 [Candidatus Heimdallarchaeota archaeon LC_2]